MAILAYLMGVLGVFLVMLAQPRVTPPPDPNAWVIVLVIGMLIGLASIFVVIFAQDNQK